MTIDVKALRALATAATPGPWRTESGGGGWTNVHAPLGVLVSESMQSADALFIAALSPDVVLALLDRLERAERAPAVSRDAGEIVDAVLSATGDSGEDLPPRVLAEAVRIVQRALDAAEERGAEAEREQRAIERRGGPGQ